jgi:hypothetical protein
LSLGRVFARLGGLGKSGPEIAAWLLLVGALRQAYVFISENLATREDLWFLFSSDTVQYGLLYRDLFEDGFHFSGWNISHAPEYVQMSWSLLLQYLGGSLATGHVLEALLQPLILALALRFTLSRFATAWPAAGPAIVALTLTLISHGLGLNLIAFIWSNRHGFTVILSLIALGLLLDAISAGRRFLLLVAVAAAGVASDLLFVVWFVGPALASLLSFARAVGYDRARRAGVAVVAGSVLGAVLFRVLTPVATVGSKVEIQLEQIWPALNRMSDVAFKSSPVELGFALTTLAGLLIAAALAVRSQNPVARIAAAWFGFMVLATVAAVAATGAPFREGAGYTRYLLAPEFCGIVVVVVAIGSTFSGRGVGALLIALAVFILPGIRPLPKEVPSAASFYPPMVRCLDEVARRHKLNYGVADYWISKYVTALSRTGVRVVSVTPRLDPFPDFTNIEWFLGGVGARRHDRPVYTFAILGSMRPDSPGVSRVALDALGPPIAVENCSGFEIRVLPENADTRIKEQFRASKRVRDYYASQERPLP